MTINRLCIEVGFGQSGASMQPVYAGFLDWRPAKVPGYCVLLCYTCCGQMHLIKT